MVSGSFLDPIERGGVRPQNNFERRDNYSTTNNNSFSQNQKPFRSIDGRTWASKDQEFNANKEYYQKLYGSKNKFVNNNKTNQL